MNDMVATLPPGTAPGAVGQALAEEQLGNWDAAARLYARAFRSALLSGDVEKAADALRGQGRVLIREERFDEAEELVELSREIAERGGLAQSAARAINVLCIILYEQQDFAAARAYYQRALELAIEVGDDELVGLASQNAGVIANITGDVREARVALLESIGSFVRSGNADNALQGYNNLGVASAVSGEWLEAEVYFSRGIEIAERLRNVPMLARLYGNRAEPLIFIGEFHQARESLRLAERAAEQVGDREALATASRWRATLARMEGTYPEAELHLHRALGLVPGVALERGEVFHELSRLREAQGDRAEAIVAERQAREIYQSIGAARRLRESELRMTELGRAA